MGEDTLHLGGVRIWVRWVFRLESLTRLRLEHMVRRKKEIAMFLIALVDANLRELRIKLVYHIAGGMPRLMPNSDQRMVLWKFLKRTRTGI